MAVNEMQMDVMDCGRVCDGVTFLQAGSELSGEKVLYPEGVSYASACIEVGVGCGDGKCFGVAERLGYRSK